MRQYRRATQYATVFAKQTLAVFLSFGRITSSETPARRAMLVAANFAALSGELVYGAK